MKELSHWDCWGRCGDRTVSRPEPNSTPERAMELLLEKVRLVHGGSVRWLAHRMQFIV